MIGKKINQLATELAPVSTDLTIIGDPISGVSKKITLAQLGAIFSGAVSFYTNLASFPVVGDINVIYCAKDTKKLYLWSGSAYVEVFPSQALLDTYQLRSEKGVSNGYASLDSGGKVPISQLPSSIMEYKGTWNAATNTPTLANGTGDTGDVYICNVAGTVNFGAGPLTFAVGDYVIYSGTIWQRSSGAVGTVTSVAATITGNAIGITGSPVTTSGTLALAFAGTSSQYINGAGNLTTFPTLTGYVPYTGATANVDLGTYDLTADIVNANDIKALTSAGLDIYSNSGTHIALLGAGGGAGVTFYGGIVGTTGSFTSNGGSDTFAITHSSGSGIALNITKGGSGEGLYINKTSGSGNAATIVGTLEATTLVKTGGTSSQFLKADGSVDSSTYVTTNTFQNISASKTFAVGFNIASAGGTNQISVFANTNSLFSGSGGSNVFGFNSANNIYFGKGLDNGGVLSWNNSAVRYYTLPDATGTIALVGGSGVGTVTSVGLSAPTGFSVSGSPVTSSGTLALSFASGYSLPTDTKQSNWDTAYNSRIVSVVAPLTFSLNTLGITQATGSSNGYLSSADWTTFNNKQSALTNPVTGTGTTNYLPKFTGTSTIGNSSISDNGTGRVSIGTTSFNDSFVISNSGAAGWEFSNSGSVITYNRSTSAYIPMTFEASNYILNRGNLGLGVTPSASADPAFQSRYGVFIGNDETNINNNAYFSSGWKYVQTGFFANRYYQNGYNGGHQWLIAPSGTAGNAISFTQAMTLNASGNLSVGNTNDTYKLDVSGTGRFTGALTVNLTSAASAINLVNTSTNNIFTTYSNASNNTYIGLIGNNGVVQTNNDFEVYTGASYTKRLTIASTGAATFSGNVNVTVPNTPEVFLTHSNTSRTFLMAVDGSNAFFRANSTNNILFQVAGGTNVMALTSGGNVGIGTTSPTQKITTVGSYVRYHALSEDNTNAGAYFQVKSGSTTVGQSSQFVDNAGNWIIYTGTSSEAERMRITSGGNVGIGTTTPGSKLSIVGLPTSSAGLSSGDIYVAAGVLMIV